MFKVIVIDDEAIIRMGIVNALKNSNFCVTGEAADGQQGLELIQRDLPDVVITDICMPLMSGIEFVENAKMISPDLKFVIISGYDDFEYVQRALQLGVCDYILKPVQTTKLLDLLTKIEADLDRYNHFLRDVQDLKRRVQESLPMLKNQFLQSLVLGKILPEQIPAQLEYLQLPLAALLHTVALFKFKPEADDETPLPETENLLQCQISRIAENIFSQYCGVQIFFISDGKAVAILSVAHSEREKVFLELNQLVKRIIVLIHRNLNMQVYAGLGKLYDQVPHLNLAYREATEALQYGLLKTADLVNYEDITTAPIAGYRRFPELERLLLQQIKLGERTAGLQTVETILQHFTQTANWDSLQLRLQIWELTVMIQRTIGEAGGDLHELFSSAETTLYEKVRCCETITDFHDFLEQFVTWSAAEIERVNKSKGYSLVEAAAQIIETALGDPEFCLDNVAAKLYLSPNYLRSIFKQQTGESFVEYLTRRRMETAQKLLRDCSVKIGNVAEQVGFSDQHYFSLCFKKFTGLTPSEYRETDGKSAD
jgi:two-component system response regulator YesN